MYTYPFWQYHKVLSVAFTTDLDLPTNIFRDSGHKRNPSGRTLTAAKPPFSVYFLSLIFSFFSRSMHLVAGGSMLCLSCNQCDGWHVPTLNPRRKSSPWSQVILFFCPLLVIGGNEARPQCLQYAICDASWSTGACILSSVVGAPQQKRQQQQHILE